jgi:hypothetical protein
MIILKIGFYLSTLSYFDIAQYKLLRHYVPKKRNISYFSTPQTNHYEQNQDPHGVPWQYLPLTTRRRNTP